MSHDIDRMEKISKDQHDNENSYHGRFRNIKHIAPNGALVLFISVVCIIFFSFALRFFVGRLNRRYCLIIIIVRIFILDELFIFVHRVTST